MRRLARESRSTWAASTCFIRVLVGEKWPGTTLLPLQGGCWTNRARAVKQRQETMSRDAVLRVLHPSLPFWHLSSYDHAVYQVPRRAGPSNWATVGYSKPTCHHVPLSCPVGGQGMLAGLCSLLLCTVCLHCWLRRKRIHSESDTMYLKGGDKDLLELHLAHTLAEIVPRRGET